jgi:broad specificity phosphatase PhoE
MAIIYMVRHGRAAAGFDAHADPGLDDTGHRQAATAAQALAACGPIPIYSSPLARARETAVPLTKRWGVEMVIEPRVAEIPSPTEDLAARSAWLRSVMGERWANLDEDLRLWRQSLIDCLLDLQEDSVVFCHFIAINVAVGAATNDDRMISFRPDNASITRLANADGVLRVVEMGREGETRVN